MSRSRAQQPGRFRDAVSDVNGIAWTYRQDTWPQVHYICSQGHPALRGVPPERHAAGARPFNMSCKMCGRVAKPRAMTPEREAAYRVGGPPALAALLRVGR